MSSSLYLLSKDDLNDEIVFNHIYPNDITNYYVSDDFSVETYIKFCKYGFISTSIDINNKIYLLPEIQFEYAVLHFENLHISRKIKSLLKKDNYILKINSNVNLLLEKLENYHKDSWLTKEYKDLIIELFSYTKSDFKMFSIELYDKNTNELISGELGYQILDIYTSLTGFSSKNKEYKNWGKLQMVLLAKYLQASNFAFWNLGHPYMQYKFDLGAISYKRLDFLKLFLPQIRSF